MARQSVVLSLACSLAAPYTADARFQWYLGFGGGSCVETCQAFGRECIPAPLPRDAIEMQSVALESRHVCAEIQRLENPEHELLAPFFDAPAAYPPGQKYGSYGTTQYGICWYPQNREYSHCGVSGPAAAEREGEADTTMTVLQRFCACSEVKGTQWVLGNPSQSCDSACAAKGGMCGHHEDQKWPVGETDMENVIRSAGVTCSSTSYGVSDAAPNFGDSGVCHLARIRNGRLPQCAASEEGVRRFCPCYDVSSA